MTWYWWLLVAFYAVVYGACVDAAYKKETNTSDSWTDKAGTAYCMGFFSLFWPVIAACWIVAQLGRYLGRPFLALFERIVKAVD